MAATGTVLSRCKLFQNGEDASPGISDTSFSSSITTSMNDIVISAGATDQVIPVTSQGTIAFLRITTDYNDSSTPLTCKINSQSDVWDINPVVEFSESITALTVSNADADNSLVINVELISS